MTPAGGVIAPVVGRAGAMVEVDDVVKGYSRPDNLGRHRVGTVAVDHVTLSLPAGHSAGLVGESGCGKTTLARLILQLERLDHGDVRLGGRSLPGMGRRELRATRRRIQLIPQDPGSSVDPRFTIERAIGEPLAAHRVCGAKERGERVRQLLAQVSLDPDASRHRIHQFSGGQRQRIAIARALALGPDVVVADEPTSALDVLVQAQILNMLQDLQRDLGLTLLLISHNLGAVRHLCESVAVMYAGQLVELAATDTLFAAPLHHYTKSLIDAIPKREPGAGLGQQARGELQAAAIPRSGCRFAPRCPAATDACSEVRPALTELRPAHWVACHFPLEGKRPQMAPPPEKGGPR